MLYHLRQGKAPTATYTRITEAHRAVVLTPQIPPRVRSQGHARLSRIHDSVVPGKQVFTTTHAVRGRTVIARAVNSAPVVHG